LRWFEHRDGRPAFDRIKPLAAARTGQPQEKRRTLVIMTQRTEYRTLLRV